jgi:opacity protein-like surface antigen
MNLATRTTRAGAIIISSFATLFMISTICSAQEWSRKGKGEFFGMVQTVGSTTMHSTIPGLEFSAKVDSTTLYGLGFGGNINDHFNLNTDFLFGSQDWTATWEDVTVTEDYNLWLWDINLDYNVWKGRLTPLVTGGIGFLNINGGLVSETHFSYNLGAGLRWDLTDNLSLKALYRWTSTWDALEDSDDKLELDGFSFGIVYMF